MEKENLENQELKTGKVEITDKRHTCPNCKTVFNDLGDILEVPEPEPLPQPEPPVTKKKGSYIDELYG